jgi:hypothetical protein
MGVKIDELIPDSKISDELIPNGSVEPVPIDKSCRLYSIWHTFELIPNGRVGLVQPPHKTGAWPLKGPPWGTKKCQKSVMQ